MPQKYPIEKSFPYLQTFINTVYIWPYNDKVMDAILVRKHVCQLSMTKWKQPRSKSDGELPGKTGVDIIHYCLLTALIQSLPCRLPDLKGSLCSLWMIVVPGHSNARHFACLLPSQSKSVFRGTAPIIFAAILSALDLHQTIDGNNSLHEINCNQQLTRLSVCFGPLMG